MSKIYNNPFEKMARLVGFAKKDAIANYQEAQGFSGWSNTFTGLGTSKDKRTGAQVTWARMTEVDAENLYAADDTAARIVDLPADMATRKWIKVKVGDEDGGQDMATLIEDELSRLKVKDNVNQALKFESIYGGSALFISCIDGDLYQNPINRNNLLKINTLNVISRWELHSHMIDYRLSSTNFMKPETYYFGPRTVGNSEDGAQQMVHHDRIVRFGGLLLPRNLFIRNNYWGDSILNKVYNALRNFNLVQDSLAVIPQDFKVGILKIKNLADLVASGESGVLQKRVQLMDMCKSILNSVLLDAEDEDFSNLQTSVNGMDLIAKIVVDRMVAATGLPHTVILGEGASGFLSGSGESEYRMLNDYVRSMQETRVEKQLDKIIELIQLQKQGPTNGKLLKSLTWEFCNLYEPSESEILENKTKQANIDGVYIDRGVVDSDEVRNSRFGGREFSYDTIIDKEIEAGDNEDSIK